LGSKRGGLEDGTALLWEVRVREVTESGVEWLWQEFIVGNLEGLGTSAAENVTQMILKDHAASQV
jgi:hypothetical protein